MDTTFGLVRPNAWFHAWQPLEFGSNGWQHRHDVSAATAHLIAIRFTWMEGAMRYNLLKLYVNVGQLARKHTQVDSRYVCIHQAWIYAVIHLISSIKEMPHSSGLPRIFLGQWHFQILNFFPRSRLKRLPTKYLAPTFAVSQQMQRR